MNKTKIEWVKNPDGSRPGWSWSPITGCLNHINGLCKGGGFPCYAYKLAHGRLRKRYQANVNIAPVYAEGGEPYHKADKVIAEIEPFYPRFWEEKLSQPMTKITRFGRDRRVIHQQRPKGIFVCDMGDLFGIGIPESWTRQVLETIQDASQHRFYLLTKQPQNLFQFSPFPENCWVGVTATNRRMFVEALRDLKEVKATVKYISIEPCLERVISKDGWIFEGAENVPIGDAFILKLAGIGWLIIGAQTKPSKLPEISWVREIVEAADKAGIPVFLKDNLGLPRVSCDGAVPFYEKDHTGTMELRQEMPKIK